MGNHRKFRKSNGSLCQRMSCANDNNQGDQGVQKGQRTSGSLGNTLPRVPEEARKDETDNAMDTN